MRILFVCLGNICRSPAAEAVMQKLVADAGLSASIEVDSAGTAGYHSGEAPDPRMQKVARLRGYDVRGAARQVRPTDFSRFDRIFAMDAENLRDLERAMPPHPGLTQPEPIARYFPAHARETEVPDPYYGGKQRFELVIDLLEDACGRLLAEIRSSLPA